MRSITRNSLWIPAFTFFFILSYASIAEAGYYKYRDENGQLHITNVPTTDKYKWFMAEEGEEVHRAHSIDVLIRRAAKKHGVDYPLVKAVIKAESNFEVRALSRAGAKGLMQLMPATAKMLGVKDIYDPSENVNGGVKFLRHLLERFKWKVPLALAAYNAGETAVRKYGTIPPYKETRNYVKKVLMYQNIYNLSSH
ncbi:MAG: transglycosylase SLT domain-containing protein [Deltaproteobacteria bacterium]|nr:transglycosylase SLT domain-containing protein [Deltaproteobacteria bacterium]